MPRRATEPCACGCGGFPSQYGYEYIRGHRPLPSLYERLMQDVTRSDSGCLEWSGSLTSTGYPNIRVGVPGKGGARGKGHRVSYEHNIGPIPEGLWVLHHCDNRVCVEPLHLFLGTNTDNVADMVNKGRNQKGEKHWNARLTREAAGRIWLEYDGRTGPWSWSRINAPRFGATTSQVYHIVSGSTWAPKRGQKEGDW